MHEPDSRVGPYLRALAAGLHALAINEDYVPLRPALAHVFALDPAMSGPILDPPEIDARSGMPGFAWMERALSEQVIARERTDEEDPSDDSIAVAERLEPELAERVRYRRALHRHLRKEELLPTTRAHAALRRLHGSTRVVLTYDRMAPHGYWVRIRADLQSAPGRTELGGMSVTKTGKVELQPGLIHLLTKHSFTPLMLLREQLQAAVDAEAMRISRSTVGPFWFPGSERPDDVPEILCSGLLLHTALEVVAHDIVDNAHRDPWRPAPHLEVLPAGHGVFRERRFAASLPILDRVEAWCVDQGVKMRVVPIRPRAVDAARR